jgi:hypothetical protein
VISAPTNRFILIGRERERQHGLIQRLHVARATSRTTRIGVCSAECSRGARGLQKVSSVERGQRDGLLVVIEHAMNQVEYDGAELYELELTREELVRDKVVLDVFVVVLEQVDADE